MTAATAATAVGAPRRDARRNRDRRTIILYLLPAFSVMAVITFFPLFFQVYMSFTDFTIKYLKPGAPLAPWVGFDNYSNIIQANLGIPNFSFIKQVIFNVWWALANVTIHVVLGVAIALLLNIKGLRFKKFWRAIYILPVVIPPIIVATVWRNMFDQNHGAVNQLLASVTGFFGVSSDVMKNRLAPLARRRLPVPAAGGQLLPPVGVLRALDRQHVARLAAEFRGRHGRAAEHPG